MKSFKVGLTVLLLVVFSVFPAPAQSDEKKIGTMDLSKVFDSYAKTKEYDSFLEGKTKEYEKERNGKIDKLREAQQKFDIMKEEEKKKLQDDIEKMRTDLIEYDRQKKTDLTKERDEKIREILLEIEKVVSDYAKKEGYTYVLNDRVLIYGDKSSDISEQILKILNNNYSPKKK